jgi:hypothetical protein
LFSYLDDQALTDCCRFTRWSHIRAQAPVQASRLVGLLYAISDVLTWSFWREQDAYTLASLFSHLSSRRLLSEPRINQVADIYNLVRVPHAIAMSKASIQQGHLDTLHAPGFEHFQEGDDVPRALLDELFRLVEKNWDWTTTDPEMERTIALWHLDRQVRAML